MHNTQVSMHGDTTRWCDCIRGEMGAHLHGRLDENVGLVLHGSGGADQWRVIVLQENSSLRIGMIVARVQWKCGYEAQMCVMKVWIRRLIRKRF